MTFREFFEALWGQAPFLWQERLANRVVAQGWPRSVAMPTAAGKTALIDIAVYALVHGAQAAARRIFFVVDRRVIVDEASERASAIADKLLHAAPGSQLWEIAESLRAIGVRSGDPLVTSVLRGGIPRDDTWAESPLQPVVISSTVDQIGSALLFRAYGASEHAWPIRAGLAALDSLIILDEAHAAQPFAQTLGRIAEYAAEGKRRPGPRLQVVEMSATPRIESFREEEEDRRDEALKKRWFAEKRAELVLVEPAEGFDSLAEEMAKRARAMRDRYGATVVGVVANRVATARAVHERLAGDRTVLLTGRARAWDRDRIWNRWRGSIALGRAEGVPEQPVFVVATQCIEAGANVDFDALVTECASIDALEQRFGRLNRAGRPGIARAAIVAQKDQVGSRATDAIYEKALSTTWAWLKKREVKEGKGKEKETFVRMGAAELRQALKAAENRYEMTLSRPDAPVLMPAHMDLLCQTSPVPAVSPDPAIFLHGPGSGPPDVQVIWRADCLVEDQDKCVASVEVCPPSAAEAIALPLWAVKRWLSGESGSGELADLEMSAEPDAEPGQAEKKMLWWKGADESRVIEAKSIRPGMTIVVPSTYGGCDEWGWNPASVAAVKDIGDKVKLLMKRPVLRIGAELAEQWGYAELAAQLRDEDADWREALAKASVVDHEIGKIVLELRRSAKLVPELALVGQMVFDQGSARSSHTGAERLLTDHLRDCRRIAEGFAAALSDPEIREHVIRAAEVHDIGKADPRFQAWLRGGNPVLPHVLIAKSAKAGQNRAAVNAARELAGYPKGGRHEVASVAMLRNSECDAVLHLVASHHGCCRPFAPCVQDHNAVEVRFGGWSAMTDHGLERAGSGIASRFWRLNREWGWYGLAFAEAVLRLADQRQSEVEREEGRSVANA